MKMQTGATARKVKAAAAGGGIGVAVATLVIYILASFGLEFGSEVEAALTVLITALVAWASGYLTRPAVADRIQAE